MGVVPASSLYSLAVFFISVSMSCCCNYSFSSSFLSTVTPKFSGLTHNFFLTLEKAPLHILIQNTGSPSSGFGSLKVSRDHQYLVTCRKKIFTLVVFRHLASCDREVGNAVPLDGQRKRETDLVNTVSRP